MITPAILLELVKESFRQPELIATNEDKNPKATFLLLDSIESRVKDNNAQNDAEDVKKLITEKLSVYHQRTSAPVPK